MTWRRLRWAVAALAGTVLAAVLWLLRDPTPRMDARRSRLAAVDEGRPERDGAATEQLVRLRATSGLAFEVAIRRPAAPERPDSIVRRPLFVLLGGHQRGKKVGALIGDTRGNVLASLEYPFEGDADAKGLMLVAQVPAIRRALYDTPAAVQLALDYLLQRPDVDSTRVELLGASFGVPFATIAAARDARVTRLWLAHGGGDPFAMIEQGLKRDITFTPARFVAAGLVTLLASGPRLAPERWIARVAPRPLVMLNAVEDERIPRASTEILWRAAAEPKQMVWLPGPHVQGDRPQVLERLVAEVLRRADDP
ncbi:MAG: hypothetical protein OEW77_03480 [Gemmatimonadota bacterium]|nr:hypothetical protein [Gemmatimonadota bacterium]